MRPFHADPVLNYKKKRYQRRIRGKFWRIVKTRDAFRKLPKIDSIDGFKIGIQNVDGLTDLKLDELKAYLDEGRDIFPYN